MTGTTSDNEQEMKTVDLRREIDASARRLLAFLEHNKAEGRFRYPFGSLFPTNCCESVSLTLSYLLEEKFGLDNVVIIKGTKPIRHEHHFWVMVGDLNYDLTAHQFAGRKPIIGALANPLFFTFPEWSIAKGRDFVDRERIVTLYRAGEIPF